MTMNARRVWGFATTVYLLCGATFADTDNGIHVGAPKVYDSRELTLMLDNLAQSLQNKSFVDPKALAAALGNLQGFQNTDFSGGFFANGAVGPGAATVFGGAAAPAAAPTTTAATSPSFTINVAPSVSTGTSTQASAVSSATASTLGPQAPALPTLQTAPSYTPNFGSNASDLLSDEVNLTYQLSNVRMLMDRSLSDRLYGSKPRLQAVVGFEIDLEPERHAVDAVATIEVSAKLSGAPAPQCDPGTPLSLVALMPEEGSHNAATLSQKANAFGGAIAASVFSIGYQAQTRNQVFYLYRDMDTVAIRKSNGNDGSLRFGWQFRPVLGQHSVEPGIRHMMVVLGLPCADEGEAIPTIDFKARESWVQYEANIHTPSSRRHWLSPTLPEVTEQPVFSGVEVPSTEVVQNRLRAHVFSVQWIPTDALNGVAVVKGENLFQGTTIRLGNRVYGTASDGLTIKSDKELEIAMPLNVALMGGSVSGRYGAAVPLAPESAPKGPQFTINSLRLSAEGTAMYQADAELQFDSNSGNDEVLSKLNRPVVLLNGVPLAGTPFPQLTDLDARANTRMLTTFFPAKALDGGATIFTVTFPFAGSGWTNSIANYDTTLSVNRLGGDKRARFLITATNRADLLCDGNWTLQLEDGNAFSLIKDPRKPIPARGGLKCADPHRSELSFEIPAKDIKPYHHFLMVNTLASGARAPLEGEIPDADPPPPKPTVNKDPPIMLAQCDVAPVTIKGSHLAQITSVLYDKTPLTIVSKEDQDIVVSIGPEITSQPRDAVGLQLMSPANDPVIAKLSITARANCKPSAAKE